MLKPFVNRSQIHNPNHPSKKTKNDLATRNQSKNLNGRCQLSRLMRRTPLGPALSVRLRVIDVCLMESQIKGVKKGRD